MMTLQEVAKELRVSRRTIYRWIKSGKFKALHFDGVYRVREQDFAVFLDRVDRAAREKTGGII